MKIKVSYVEVVDPDKLGEAVNKELEALQVNVNNHITDIKTFVSLSGSYIAQISYMEITDDAPMQILNEGVVLQGGNE